MLNELEKAEEIERQLVLEQATAIVQGDGVDMVTSNEESGVCENNAETLKTKLGNIEGVTDVTTNLETRSKDGDGDANITLHPGLFSSTCYFFLRFFPSILFCDS